MIGLLLVMNLFGHHASGVERHVLSAGNWRVKVTHDAFANTTACTLRARGMEQENAGVVFHLGSGRDTSAAVYRIDGGAPRESVDARTTYRIGIYLGSGSVENPSGGLVAVPLTELAGGRVVEMQARRGERPQRFDVSHVGEAVLAARAAGCPTRGTL